MEPSHGPASGPPPASSGSVLDGLEDHVIAAVETGYVVPVTKTWMTTRVARELSHGLHPSTVASVSQQAARRLGRALVAVQARRKAVKGGSTEAVTKKQAGQVRDDARNGACDGSDHEVVDAFDQMLRAYREYLVQHGIHQAEVQRTQKLLVRMNRKPTKSVWYVDKGE